MQLIISFLIRNKFFLLFLFLQIIALSLTIQSHSYHRSKFINSSNFITGGIYSNFNAINDYFYLKKHNEQLATENTTLKNLLSQNNKKTLATTFTALDSLIYQQKYTYIHAEISKNDFTKSNNFLTLNRGKNDGLTSELGVITSKGIIGITTNTSAKYATVMSILNKNSRINAKLKNNAHFGTLTWNGKDYNTLQFEDVPIQANIKIGDTIITGGKSTIFPKGILIGQIKDFNVQKNKYQIINIQLFNDMSALNYVNVITNLDKLEIKSLEKSND